MNCPLYHYVMSIFVSCHLFWLEVYFVWYEYGYMCFFGGLSFAWSNHSPSLYFELMFVFRAEMSLLEGTYRWVLIFNPFSHSDFWVVNSIYLQLEWLLIDKDVVLPFYLLFSGCSISLLFLFPPPVLYSRPSPTIYLIQSSVYMSIPISKSIPSLSFLGVHTFVLYICVSISALQIGSSLPPRFSVFILSMKKKVF